MGVLLRTEGATKAFGGLVAVNEVDLEVEEGEIRGLVGPNGAGKTTLFNLITGYHSLTRGRVVYLGHDMTTWSVRRRVMHGVTRTFQTPQLFGEMSVLQNVIMGGYPLLRAGALDALLRTRAYADSVRKGIERAEHLLEFVGVSGDRLVRAENLPYAKQRLTEIARALMVQPRLLLLDEPAAGLNPADLEGLTRLIRQLRDQGTTILLVEHNMRLMMGTCDRMAVLDFGRKIADGSPAEVRADPHVIEAYLGVSA